MWLKGNLHTHTTFSDGDSEPSEVCRRYADNGYHFLSITDHGVFVDPADLRCSDLVLIPGIELSTAATNEPQLPIHVNGFGIRGSVAVQQAETKSQTVQNCIDAIRAAGGIAQINHPNFHFALNAYDISRTRGACLLEIYNGHPQVQNDGDEAHIGVEELWDQLLTAGMLIYGTAVDDSHHFRGEFHAKRANPFRGWVWVRVRKPSVREILHGLATGDFYASTGVRLQDTYVDGWRYYVIIDTAGSSSNGQDAYVTQFIGDNGKVLLETTLPRSEFNLRQAGGARYVRARVLGPNGTKAWCQPRLIPEFWRR
ncbi:MAG: CehA/McbA family metallohydrolase [Armatimonadota bacterium]|nr:CehA/McbA family metallohydrolase [Armatimonadota bacterium]